MADEVDEYELEKLRAEIQQERQMKEMLDQSARELRITVEELEKRYEAIESEGNEWKTRFETQEEMNQQLERQIIMLQDKIEEAKRNLKDGTHYAEKLWNLLFMSGKTPRDMKSFDDLSDANPAMVKSMEREKNLLYNQLRDLEWRLDQESKAYHKANDERKQYVVEINATKGNIDSNKARQRAAVSLQQREVDEMSRSPRLLGSKLKLNSGSPIEKEPREKRNTSRVTTISSRLSQTSRGSIEISNIPEDQRIIDPKKGPIKKTAAVKNLPSLETT